MYASYIDLNTIPFQKYVIFFYYIFHLKLFRKCPVFGDCTFKKCGLINAVFIFHFLDYHKVSVNQFVIWFFKRHNLTILFDWAFRNTLLSCLADGK